MEMPARSAAPPGRTALTCCRGAYSSPLMLLSCPPSLTCPRTLKPYPESDFTIRTSRGPDEVTVMPVWRLPVVPGVALPLPEPLREEQWGNGGTGEQIPCPSTSAILQTLSGRLTLNIPQTLAACSTWLAHNQKHIHRKKPSERDDTRDRPGRVPCS